MPRASALVLLVCALALSRTASAQEWKRYIWIGPPSHDAFDIIVDVMKDENEFILLDNPKGDTSDPPSARVTVNTTTQPLRADKIYQGKRNDVEYTLHLLSFRKLKTGTQHHIYAKKKDTKEISYVGSVWTLPAKTGVFFPMKVAVASCQVRSRDSEALREISMWNKAVKKVNEDEHFFFLHTGDLHYSDIGTNSPDKYEAATRNVVTDFSARKLFSSVPVAYMVDDHDYGRNNAGASSPSRPAVQKNYDAMIAPAFNASKATKSGDGMYNAFTVGNVRFILTDLRSNADKTKQQLLGSEQTSWFTKELNDANKYDLVVWVSSRPWISKAKPGSDTWGGFALEREKIAGHIVSQKVNNLIMVSGDAHMLAADDGSNSMYVKGKTSGGFPVIHAAPLSNFGSSKGGPYSHGCKTYRLKKNKQYGILSIAKDPKTSKVTVDFNGYTVSHLSEVEYAKLPKRNKPVISMSLTAPFLAAKSTGGAGKCKIPLAPWWWFFAFALAVLALLCLCLFCGVKRRARKKEKMMEENPNLYGESETLATDSQLGQGNNVAPQEQAQHFQQHQQQYQQQHPVDEEVPQRF